MKKKFLLIYLMFLSISNTWSQGFKVSGNQLLDANGNNFVMKGINVPLAWFVNDVNNNIINIKTKTGANCLRIVVNISSSDNSWQTCVQRCIDNKIIPMVELHDVTGNNSPSELNRMAQFWASKSTFLKRPDIAKYILINIANEWGDWYMSATATGTVSRVTWRNAYITAVNTIRNAGINTTLVIDAAGYGQDNKAQTLLTYAKEVQAADPQHNCLFSVHMYCEWTGNSSITTHLPAIKNAGIPVMIGEFGFQHSEGSGICNINETQIMSTANSNGIGWLAWSWKGNGGGVEYLDLSSDWAGNNLSAWGNTIVNGSGGTKTAVNASVFSTTPNTPPTINISSPANNSNFIAPASIALTANASDADGTVSNVQFYNGTVLLGSDATAPYTFSWTAVGAGTYSLTARATDNSGAVTTSSIVSVMVSGTPNTPPAINISSPANNSNFIAPASIALTANASDADGTVSNVQFYNGTVLLGSDATAPYTFSWTAVGAGTYSLTARATDNNGAVTTSSIVSVTVSGTPNTPPTINISNPVNNTSVVAPASIVISANAADANGTISNVQFYNGTTLLGSDAISPYSFTWSNVAAGTYSLTARATDNAGAVTTSETILVTVTGPVSTAEIIGPDCGANNTTLTFELNATKRANVTSYNWWYTGSAASTAAVAGASFRVNVQTGGSFSSGQICVGTNLSVAPWYTSYCKSIAKCSGAREGTESGIEEILKTTVSPNPSTALFTLVAGEEIQSYTMTNYLGVLVLKGNTLASGQSVSFGESLENGTYMLRIHYVSGRVETKMIQKIL